MSTLTDNRRQWWHSPVTVGIFLVFIKNIDIHQKQQWISSNYYDDNPNLHFKNNCRYGDFSLDEKNYTTTVVVVVVDSVNDTYDYKKIESSKISSYPKMQVDNFIYLKKNLKNDSEENKY